MSLPVPALTLPAAVLDDDALRASALADPLLLEARRMQDAQLVFIPGYDVLWDAWEQRHGPRAYAPSPTLAEYLRLHWQELLAAPRVAVFSAPVLTEPWMEPFLAEFAKSKNITQAAKAGPVHRDTVRVYRQHDPEFARAYDLAIEEYRDAIRATIKERAVDGWDEPVYGRMDRVVDGKVLVETVVVGYVRKHDNRVLLRHAETELDEYAATRAGQKVEVHASATASANATAQAVTVVATPELLEKLRGEHRLQLEKRLARATRQKPSSAPPEPKPAP